MSAQFIQFYSTLVAILALISLASAVVLIGVRVSRGPNVDLGGPALWLAWLVAVVATVGSLIYSEVIHFEPCRLCWYQRIAMYPMAIILLVGAIRREAVVKFYALPLAVVGLGISVWHYLIQTFPNLSSGACRVRPSMSMCSVSSASRLWPEPGLLLSPSYSSST